MTKDALSSIIFVVELGVFSESPKMDGPALILQTLMGMKLA